MLTPTLWHENAVKADPEHVRALERAKYVRRVARDPEGYRAKRRAIEVRYRQKKLAKHRRSGGLQRLVTINIAVPGSRFLWKL